LLLQLITKLRVSVLNLILLGLVDQTVKLFDSLVRGGHDLSVVHLESEVTFGNQSASTLINLLDQGGVKVDAKLLSVGLLFI